MINEMISISDFTMCSYNIMMLHSLPYTRLLAILKLAAWLISCSFFYDILNSIINYH